MAGCHLERLIAFTEFDIFAYLIVGLVLLAACDVIFGSRLIFRQDWGFGLGTMVAVLAYVLGHLVSVPADWLLEEGLAKHAFGRPSDNLVLPVSQIPKPCPATSDPGFWRSTVFGYGLPLTCELQAKVREKAPAETGDALFYKAYVVARSDPSAAGRMLIFSRLYIFSRNMAFAAFLAAVMVLATPACRQFFRPPDQARTLEETATALPIHQTFRWLPAPWVLSSILFVTGLVLLHRYLMFYRLFSVEVFTAFASSGAAAVAH